MSFPRILIEKIKGESPEEVYDLWDQNTDKFNQQTTKTFLSFLGSETDLGKMRNYFDQVITLYQEKWSYDIPTYALVIRINCLLGEYGTALEELLRLETEGISGRKKPPSELVSTRMVRPFFEKLPDSNPEILIGLFRRYRHLLKSYDYYNLLTKLSSYVEKKGEKSTSKKALEDSPDLSDFLKYETALTTEMVLETVRHIIGEFIKRQEIIPKSLMKLIQKWFPDYQLTRINSGTFLNGQCFYCNNFLVPQFLSSAERQAMATQILDAYKSMPALGKLKNWLQRERRWEKPTFIIDAGNVGYYQKAAFSYWQIDRMINLLIKKYSSYFQSYFGTKELPQIIVFIHHRHLKFKPEKVQLRNRPKRELTSEEVETMSQSADRYITKWKKNKYIYSTPSGCNDDLFWLLASFMIEKSITITNDQMRDHHVDKIDSNLFYRWRERHVASYCVIEQDGSNVMEVNMPLPYSMGFQEIVGEHSLVKGWHIPVFNLPDELEQEIEEHPEDFPDPKYFPDPVKNHVELIVDPKEITWYCLSKSI